MISIKNFINGSYCESLTKDWLEVINPSNGEIYAKLPNSNTQDVNQAYLAAEKAFHSWSKTSVDQRSVILAKIAELIEDQMEILAAAESMDNGKPISLARAVDIPRAAYNFKFFSQAVTQFYSESHEQISDKPLITHCANLLV